MRPRLVILATLLAAVGFTASPLFAQVPDDFDYQIEVKVSNTTGAALSDTPVAVNMQPANLVSGGYIQADADDLLATDLDENSLGVSAQGMGGTDITWWLDVDAVADDATQSFFFHIGDTDATRDQTFRFDGSGDTVTATDHADLDITDNLGLQATVTSFDTADLPDPAVPDNPGGIWNFNECTGNPTDDSGNGNDATANSADWFMSETYTQVCSLDFEASNNDEVQIPHSADITFSDGETATFEMAFKPESVGISQELLTKGQPGSDANYIIRVTSSNELEFEYADQAVPQEQIYTTDSAHITSTGTNYHIAFSYTYGTGSSAQFYVDGVAVAGSWTTGTGNTSVIGNTDDVFIGSRDTTGFTDGIMDNVRIWRDARTVTEISDNPRNNYGDINYIPIFDKTTLDTSLSGSGGYALHFGRSTAAASGVGARFFNGALGQKTSVTMDATSTFEATFIGGTITIYEDDSQVGSTGAAGFSTVGTNSEDVVAGALLDGRLGDIEIRSGETSLDAGTAQLTWDFEADELEETQQGKASNSWTWTGTVEDVSAGGVDHDGTYSLTRDMSNITVFTESLEIKDLPDDAVVSEDIRTILGDDPVDPEATRAPASFPLRGFWDDAATQMGTTVQGFWFMVLTMFGGALGLVVWRTTKNELVTVGAFVGMYWIGYAFGMGIGLWIPLLITLVGIAASFAIRKWVQQ